MKILISILLIIIVIIITYHRRSRKNAPRGFSAVSLGKKLYLSGPILSVTWNGSTVYGQKDLQVDPVESVVLEEYFGERKEVGYKDGHVKITGDNHQLFVNGRKIRF